MARSSPVRDNKLQAQSQYVAMIGSVMKQLDGLLFDVRAALRGVLRDRAFSLTAVATLAVAMALNVTVFTVRDAMLFRGLPLAERSDRLLYLAMRKPTDLACCPSPVPYSDFEAWRADARAFEGLAFRTSGQPITFRDSGSRPLDMMVSKESVNTFQVLGVKPMLGRDFTAVDEIAGAPPVAILSYQFWERRFNKRADSVGSIVHVNGSPTTIVGVMPKGFTIVYEEDLWMPLTPSASIDVGVIGRLRDGATIEQARVELQTITQRLHASDPPASREVPSVLTYSQAHVAPDAPVIYGTLWAGAWFVLLIACANLVNLTLARTAGRWREYSTRIALGAGASRMVRQMLIESVLLAGVAALLAWPIIKWTVRTWADATASRYLALDYSVNVQTLWYLLSIATAAAIVIPLLAIARALRLRAGGMLKAEARGVTQGPRGKRLTTALVAGQMTLAIVLLLGTGVLVRSFEKIVGADTGVRDAGQVMTGLVGLPSDKYPSLPARVAFLDRLREQIRTIPGTEAVSFASTIPTRGIRARSVEIEGRTEATDGGEQIAIMNAEADYFRTMGRPAISGRDFSATDDAAAPRVVLVNESLAAAFWPGDTALGKRLRMIDGNVAGPWRTVVGVTPNLMQGDPTRQAFKPVIYVPIRQQALVRPFVFVRSRLRSDEIIQAVLAEVQKLDPDVITEQFGPLEAKFAFDRDWMDLEHADLGKHAAIAPVFSIIALVLAAVGLVAVIAHSVSQRTKEIGVRIAIGAASRDIAAMIMREGMRPVAIGLVVGLVAAAGSNRLLQSQLVGISPYDPVTIVAGPLILIVAALIACRIPARRAMQVDPIVALRNE